MDGMYKFATKSKIKRHDMRKMHLRSKLCWQVMFVNIGLQIYVFSQKQCQIKIYIVSNDFYFFKFNFCIKKNYLLLFFIILITFVGMIIQPLGKGKHQSDVIVEIFAESRCFENIICQQVIAKCHLIFRMISKSHVLIVIKFNFEK